MTKKGYRDATIDDLIAELGKLITATPHRATKLAREAATASVDECLQRARAAIATATTAFRGAGIDVRHEAREAALVLVIDDAEDNRDLYAQFLALNGYRVITACDGSEGLAVAREAHPDVIVLDLGLPFVDGWEVTRLLRADPATSEQCIIACSGHATGEARQRALDSGVDAYLMKPCNPNELLAEITRLRPALDIDR